MSTLPRLFLLMAGLAVISSFSATAQYEFLATLDPSDLSVNRIANIPQVTWVTGNSTFDEIHHRFFFQGNPTGAIPFDLYTIDAVTGAVLFKPQVTSSNPRGTIDGLQYDNAKDTLYAIYLDGTGAGYFSWVDPATGVAHPVKTIPSFAGYSGSTFDKKDHVYICLSGSTLFAIDASTGNVLHQSNLAAGISLSQMVYNNSDGLLYGICRSNTLTHPQFDSITLATGAAHVISDLPPLTLPTSIYAYTIDETSGKYIFVGADPPPTNCIKNHFYVLDLPSGAILSRTLYPYAQNAGLISNENVIAYSFDHTTNRLYALNWHPPPAVSNPYINITVSENPVCPGETMTFTATPGATVVNPSYTWFVNGLNTGGITGPVYSRDDLAAGDTVYCVITDHAPCAVNSTDTSNRIGIKPNLSFTASIAISVPSNNVCEDNNVTFTAAPILGGPSPSYQWQLNSNPVGTNSPTFSHSGWTDGDVVNCIMTSSSSCAIQKIVTSNDIVMQVTRVNSSVNIDATHTTVCTGDTVQFTANSINGGSHPHYQWQIDGNNTGPNSDVFIISSLKDGDIVSCILAGSIACSLPVQSANTIKMTVNPRPTVTIADNIYIARGKSVQLNPSITGAIAEYKWTPATGLDNPALPDPVTAPLITTAYQLLITANNGCSASAKTTINVFYLLEMPGAFTPNGDGRNDLFRIPPSSPEKVISFSIYNRWGEIVFFTANSDRGWDGTFKGQKQPAGEYVWKIDYEDARGVRRLASGNVMLVR